MRVDAIFRGLGFTRRCLYRLVPRPAWGQPPYLRMTPGGGLSAAENSAAINFSRVSAPVAQQNPQVAFASARINESFAQLNGAKVLWLPSICAGVYFGNHDGPFQANDGTIVESNRSTLQAGLGMAAVGGGSPAIPGLTANFHVTDAVFQPRIAQHEVAARQQAAHATCQDLLLEAAVAYLNLLRAHQQCAIARETLDHAAQLADLTTAFARTGQGSAADADRAQTELAVRKNAVAQAVAQTRVASARLAELAGLDPSQCLVPQEPARFRSCWFPDKPPRGNWWPTACRIGPNWPRATTWWPKPWRPWSASVTPRCCPVSCWASAKAATAATRTRPSALALRFISMDGHWELLNLGVGEAAARQGARSRGSGQVPRGGAMDQVAREIVEAQAQTESLSGQIAVGAVGDQRGQRVLPAERGAHPRRTRIALGSAAIAGALDQSRREYLRGGRL